MSKHEQQSKRAGLLRFPRGWSGFHTFEDFESAPPISFAIDKFLQNDGATFIGGLSGHGKTLVMLSVVKALLAGRGAKLWNHFDVLETASRIVYLIPESTITPFKHRLELFGLYDYLEDGRLLVRTLSLGTTKLSDANILAAAKGAYVFLDSAIRFVEGNENDAADNQNGLADSIFALLRAGARSVAGAHHSPKAFGREDIMTKENMLRGSGDIGAMVTTAWGIKQLDPLRNIIHVENVKSRDFEPGGPFQLVGRPWIDRERDFRIFKKPGECKSLREEQKPLRNTGGASAQERKDRARKVQLVEKWMERYGDDISSKKLVAKFRGRGITVAASTARKYRLELVAERSS